MTTNLLKKPLWVKRNHPLLYPLCFALCLVLPVATAIHAQPTHGISPVETALGGSIAARVEHPWLARANPATLSPERISLHASFAPSSIGIEGYHDGGLLVALPFDPTIRLAAAFHAAGVRSYREVTATAIGAFDMPGAITIGFAATLNALAIDGYGAASAPTFDLGIISRLSERIRWGGAFKNMGRNEIAGVALPQRILLGFAFDMSPGTTLSVDMMHELRRSATASVGFSTIAVTGVTLRAGVANAPGTIALGAGYDLNGIAIDYGGAYVAPLGLRHAIGIGYRW